MKKIILLVVLLNICGISYAQSSLVNSIDKITGTDFFKGFDSLKKFVQLAGLDVAKNQKKYSATQLELLKTSYDASVKEINNVLVKMAEDFTDKKKIKLLKNDPETYINSYLYLLKNAKTNFQDNFLKQKSEIDQSLGLYTFNPAILIPLIKGAIELVREVRTYIDEIKKASLEEVHRQIVDKHQLTTWAELAKAN